MSKITVPLSKSGVDTLLKEVQEYKKWLNDRTQVFVKRLGEIGLNIASVEFQNAQYDGSNDVSVHMEDRGGNKTAVVAVGRAVLFIEFGTGITYPNDHPQAGELGMERGGYGYKLGRLPSWRYEGDPGTSGEKITEGKHKGEIRTKGNPANMPMYKAAKEIEQQFKDIAREVFKR